VLSCGESQLNTYPTIEAARADRLFARGWIPDVLPDGSGPIVEAHDLDSNARCSRAAFPSGAIAEVSAALNSHGFVPFRSALPTLPFARCPFSLAEAQRGRPPLHKTHNALSDTEFAVISEEGVLYFWSS